MYRAVFDTNVYVSAAAFGGKPEILLKLCWGMHKQFELYTSHEILKETARVLADAKFQFTREEISDTVASIVYAADVIEPKARISVIADEADNRVLECAIEAKADYVVSGDRHLVDLGKFEGMSIIKPAEFLEILERR